jgi:hypothetical protein
MTSADLKKIIDDANQAMASLPENRIGANNAAYYYGIGNRTTAHRQGELNSSVGSSVARRISDMGLSPAKYKIADYKGGTAYNLPAAIEDARLNLRLIEMDERFGTQLENVASREATYNTLSEQILALGGGRGAGGTAVGMSGPAFNEAMAALGGGRNFGASDLATQLNFQVSDEQILNDINNSRINRLNNVVNSGNAQIAGINERLNTARNLLNQLPAGDPRRASSEVVVNQLTSDLNSVTEAVTDASEQIKNYKPVTADSEDGLREIVAFREYIQLPEERATQQLRQIDPNAYRTAVGLGQRYRQMATEPLPETTTEPTERLRQTIEQEALNQLSLGATLGAEERRGYEQAVRAAQTARGNIFGLGPAVQEAAQIGAAGEQRKLARYGAALQFLGSGETTGAAQARDLALRDALTQQRLGAAAGFIAGGPSIANLAQARTQQQQAAMQNYVAASMAGPGGFAMAPSTAQNFYQTTNPEIPVALTAEFNKLYGSQASYQAQTYGAQTQAIASSYTSPSRAFANIAGGLSGLVPSFSFSR